MGPNFTWEIVGILFRPIYKMKERKQVMRENWKTWKLMET